MSGPSGIARDYVVSTTYRKHGQSGRKWAELRAGSPGGGEPKISPRSFRPEEDYRAQEIHRRPLRAVSFPALVPGPGNATIGSIAGLSGGVRPAAGSDPETALATILEHVALPLRWEPLNGASPHRAIPSGGGIFGAELFLIADGGDGPALFRQIPQDGALRIEGARPGLNGLLAGADLAFAIVGNLASYTDPYGEFSPVLASLECGIMQAQLSLLCAAHGWTCEIETRHDHRAVAGALGLDHWSRVPAAIVRVAGPGAADAAGRLRRETLSTSESIPPFGQADDYPRMRALVEAIAGETLPAAPPESRPVAANAAAFGSPADLLDVMRRRSSGPTEDLTRATGRIAMAELTALAGDVAALQGLEGRTDLDGVRLALVLFATDQLAGIDCPFALDPRSGRLSPDSGPSGHWTRLAFTIGVDDVAEERRSGSRAFLLNHLAAGALAQRICLAATARGLFARPVRGYDDVAADRLLALDSRAILQILCGVPRRVNPAYDLGWR